MLALLLLVGGVPPALAVVLVLVNERYPESAWRFLCGIVRWEANVLAYLGSLTDHYPPFALQNGSHVFLSPFELETGRMGFELYPGGRRGSSDSYGSPRRVDSSTWGWRSKSSRGSDACRLDRRGYARSGGDPVRSISTHTADAATVLEYLGPSPPSSLVRAPEARSPSTLRCAGRI